jgi:sugar/nucleoside kinase (ribokinase family)
MTLSVNENEAAQLCGNYNEVFKEEAPEAGIVRVREKTGLDELVIHTPRLAVCSSAAEGVATSDQTFCVSPVITAGAGDTFNAGYIAATLAGLNAKERLISANAAAYYYVSNGGAPGRKELTCEINGIVGI